MNSWWWNGELSWKEVRERLQLKEALRQASHEQLLAHAEQLVDYSIQQRSLFRAALRRVMELEAQEALGRAEVLAAELSLELGIAEYDDAAG